MNESKHRPWPLILMALPAAVAIWSGWVGLGELAGFGLVQPLPGILRFHLNTAITLPIGVEAYGAYALGAWLRPGTPDAARRFARWSAIGALALGGCGQVAYHLLAAFRATRAPVFVIVVVACIPVVALGFGAALAHLLRAGRETADTEKASFWDRPIGAAVAARIAPRPAPDPVPGPAVPAATESAAGAPEPVPEPRQPERQNPRQRTARKPPAWHAKARRAVARNSAISAEDLAVRCGVSERSAYRYLQENPPVLHAVAK